MGRLVNFYHHHVSLVHKAGYTALGIGVGTAALVCGQQTVPHEPSSSSGLPPIQIKGTFDEVIASATDLQEKARAVWRFLPTAGFGLPTLQRLATWSNEPQKRDLMAAFGGARLMEWLLKRAHGPLRDTERLAAEHALTNLLGSSEGGRKLLVQEGAVPGLLHLIGHSKNPQRLADALLTAATRAPLHEAALLDDIRETIHQAEEGSSRVVREAALGILGAWAQASVMNCGKMATMGAGPALFRILQKTESEPSDVRLQLLLLKLMATLASDCPLRNGLDMSSWLDPLLYLAADAAAQQRTKLAATALHTFCICLSHGANLQAARTRENLFPLLRVLAGRPDAEMRKAVAGVIGCLAAEPSGPSSMTEQDREAWTETVCSCFHPPS
eukprot:jgi/Botrbrau1/19069/Bobra.0876s0001.1